MPLDYCWLFVIPLLLLIIGWYWCLVTALPFYFGIVDIYFAHFVYWAVPIACCCYRVDFRFVIVYLIIDGLLHLLFSSGLIIDVVCIVVDSVGGYYLLLLPLVCLIPTDTFVIVVPLPIIERSTVFCSVTSPILLLLERLLAYCRWQLLVYFGGLLTHWPLLSQTLLVHWATLNWPIGLWWFITCRDCLTFCYSGWYYWPGKDYIITLWYWFGISIVVKFTLLMTSNCDIYYIVLYRYSWYLTYIVFCHCCALLLLLLLLLHLFIVIYLVCLTHLWFR